MQRALKPGQQPSRNCNGYYEAVVLNLSNMVVIATEYVIDVSFSLQQDMLTLYNSFLLLFLLVLHYMLWKSLEFYDNVLIDYV